MIANLAIHPQYNKANLKVLRFEGAKTTDAGKIAFTVNQEITKAQGKLEIKAPEEQKLNYKTLTVDEAITILAQKIRSFTDNAEKLAFKDSLTGLLNKNAYNNRDRKKFVLEACQKQNPLGVVFIDLNKFKPINDVFGHEEGDKALKVSAKTLKTIVGDKGKVYRNGGDEFLVLLPDSKFKETGEIAEKLRINIEKTTKALKESGKLQADLTASIGYSTFDPQSIEDSEDITKNKGRNGKFGEIMNEYQKAYNRADNASYVSKGYAHRGGKQRAYGLEK